MNNWETAYSRHLDTLKFSGDIKDFRFEPMRLILAPKTTYLPDFMVILPDGSIEIHEVKGFMREDAVVKFKLAAHLFPFWTFIMVRKTKDGWQEIKRLGGPADVEPKREPVKLVSDEGRVRRAVPVSKSVRSLSYAEMSNNPEYAYILRLKPSNLRDLREAKGLSSAEMARRLGMEPVMWYQIESGEIKLYHYRHVAIIKKMLEDPNG